MFSDVLIPGFPVGSARPVHQDQRHKAAFSRLHQGESFIAFIQGAETAGEENDCIRMPEKSEFSGKEVLESNEFLILLNDGIGVLFPGQTDIGAETFFAARPFVACLHDAGTGPGKDHPAFFGDAPGKCSCLPVLRLIGLRPGGPEQGCLAGSGIGGE